MRVNYFHRSPNSFVVNVNSKDMVYQMNLNYACSTSNFSIVDPVCDERLDG